MSLLVGLTGGIGSGKTTVADLFAELGAAIVDTDAIAHELTSARGIAMPMIIGAFGGAVVSKDGSLDRAAMRRLCFSDPAGRRRLEAILHPLIRDESAARCRRAARAPYVLLVVPLLLESGVCRERVDRILVVDCDEARQVARVMARSALSEKEVRGIMAAQASRAERLAVADDVLSNTGARDELREGVLALHRYYVELGGSLHVSGRA
ncbi:MAG: dephospho-CoA kinase [Candidatus Accumulibacter sp.]|jgi:dephospho-CoA kinase|nr:dephospho-CoA kinase [Accumulibacter sp.]